MFAFEDALQGKTIDDAYADDDLVGYGLAAPGDEILAWGETGHSFNEGDLVESAGDGTLQPVSGNFPVAVVREALDLTATAASRLKVRVL